MMDALAAKSEPAEALTLLDALARAPAAAALVVAALERAEDRKALRLVHPQLRDAVGEATTKLEVRFDADAATRPPTARRWPRLEELRLDTPDLAAIEALGSATWRALRSLSFGDQRGDIQSALDAPAARALAAALRQMPALRALELWSVVLSDDAAAALFRAPSNGAVPQLRALTLYFVELMPAAARLLAATGWRLEELNLFYNSSLGAAGLAPLLAAPTFALRRLDMVRCRLRAADILTVANASWPLEELRLLQNDFSAAAAGPALAALSRHARLRRLSVSYCELSAAGFKALVEAAWPALLSFSAHAKVEFVGPHALGAAAFAGFPAIEELDLSDVKLGAAGAAVLASRRWPRLRELTLICAQLSPAGAAARGVAGARGAQPGRQRPRCAADPRGRAALGARASAAVLA